MKIKEYNQMKEELIKDDRGDSTGAFRNFVREQRALDQEPRTMAQGGRIGFQGGLSVAKLGYNIAKPLINPLIKKYLPEIGALGASGTLALRDRDKDETKETIITKKKKDLTEPPEGPEGPDILDVVETAMTAKEIIDLKEKFKNKAWKDTVIIKGSPAYGTREAIPQRTNLPFLEELNKYSKQFHDGNLKSAIRELGGFKKIVGKRDNQTESFYTTIQNAAKRSGFKFETFSDKLTSLIPPSKVPLTIVDLTTQLRTNPGVLDNRIKELNIDLDKVYNRKELQDIVGVKRGNKRQDDFFFEILKDQGLEYKELPGGKVGFTANEAIEAFKTYAKNKLRNWESRGFSGNLKKKSTENYNLRVKIDGQDFANFQRLLNKRIDKIMKQEDLYFPNSAAEIGHNPVPIAFTEKIEMLNDPALANKIYNLQNYTWQGKEINYDTLAYTSGALERPLKVLDKYYNQEVTKKNIGAIETAIDDIHAYYNSAIKKGGEMVKNLPFHKDVIGKLDITVPQIGDTLTSENFEVDMSDVDKRHIIGNIDLINPEVVKYKDLSLKEKIMYGQNVLDQKIEQIKEFYGPKGANYPPDIIEDFITKLEIGRPDKANPIIGLAESKGFGYKSGGPVKLDFSLPEGFAGGGMAGIRRPSAIPPESGPQSQGLASLKKYGSYY